MKFISLRWKISGVLIISNFILGILMVIIVNHTVTSSLSKELIERGRTIAVDLGHYSAELLLEKDRVGLKQIIMGSLNSESVEYILIQDDEKDILADTYNGQVPVVLTKAEMAGDLTPQIVDLDEENSAYDIWVPVEEGELGYIRVGMKKSYITDSVYETNLIVIGAIVIITLIGIVVVLILANRIIKPILYLTERADQISQGNLEEEVKVNTKDEIESLGMALERLRESVKIALERLKKHQTLRM
ncbi:MAG: HAMP domain-containing protein [Calditrichaceae bacterium]|nr:HAMP domain-containing protein [Calditrichaceae bacterium]MBN2707941.1 HAMP domain-containing protein [Calditrichaceae bacterium]RQV95378.1 MAG: HAMP domain-containing protein [Calditrichota bacterium]